MHLSLFPCSFACASLCAEATFTRGCCGVTLSGVACGLLCLLLKDKPRKPCLVGVCRVTWLPLWPAHLGLWHGRGTENLCLPSSKPLLQNKEQSQRQDGQTPFICLRVSLLSRASPSSPLISRSHDLPSPSDHLGQACSSLTHCHLSTCLQFLFPCSLPSAQVNTSKVPLSQAAASFS